MRKEEREKEHDMTTHLINIFTHATKFSPYEHCTVVRDSSASKLWGLYNPSVGSSPPNSLQLPGKMKQKHLAIDAY